MFVVGGEGQYSVFHRTIHSDKKTWVLKMMSAYYLCRCIFLITENLIVAAYYKDKLN